MTNIYSEVPVYTCAANGTYEYEIYEVFPKTIKIQIFRILIKPCGNLNTVNVIKHFPFTFRLTNKETIAPYVDNKFFHANS